MDDGHDCRTVDALVAGSGEAGGVVLHRSSEVVGVSNLFAVDSSNGPAVWSTAITMAASHFPGYPLVGYEHGDALALALAFGSGFFAVGTLRVWLHRP